MSRHFVALSVSFLLPIVVAAQVPPEKAVSTMKVADGLQIELFAAEPMLVNPTSIDVDHLGRVWVCEAVNYRRVMFNRPILRPEGDRIVILEDTKGVGKADKVTVFYQGKEIIAPIGICVAPLPPSPQRKQGACKVFVCQSPDILLFEDLDGDGKADGPPKKFLTGFKGFDHDHGVHGINIGPDGKLYFTVGDAGVDGLQSSDGKGRKWKSNNTDCRAGTVWRCDMDGKNLELIAHNFRNNYECCVNSFGEIWLSDNDDDGNEQTRICHVMPGGNYGYHPRGPGQSHWHEEQPGIVHKVLRTGFGSPTGICFYEGTLLPKKYWGQLLHCDAGPREFRCFHIKPKGAGYEAEKEVLVTSSDNWFRLSDVCVAPDGSIFLADWYDPGVGGHGMGDWTRGRIFRVTPKGHVGYKVPKVDVEARHEIPQVLDSPCLAARWMAIRKLQDLSSEDVVGILGPSLEQDRDIAQKARAAWQFARFTNGANRTRQDILAWHKANSSLHKAGDDVMSTVIRFEKASGMFELLLHILSSARMERSPAANREILLALRNLTAEFTTMLNMHWLLSQYDGQDRYYLSALNIACGTDPERRAKILADFDKHFPELNDKVLDLIWELRPPGAVARLEKHLNDPGLKAPQRGRIVDILASSDDPAVGKRLLTLLTTDAPLEVKSRAVENLKLFLPTKWSSLTKSEEFKSAVEEMLAKPQASAGLQLVSAAKYTPAIPQVAQLAAGHDKEAIRTLGKLPDQQAVYELVKLLRALLIPESRPVPPKRLDVAAEIIGALGAQTNGPGSAQGTIIARYTLEVIVRGPDHPVEAQRAAIEALAGSQAGTETLLKLKEEGQLPAALVAETGRLLRKSPFQGLRNKALIAFPPPGKLDPAKLPALALLAKRTGNAERGRKLMEASLTGEMQCLKCHTIRGAGGKVGPDLSKIGEKGSRENLLESILFPSKAIADQFIQWRIETKKGLDIQGLIIEETADSILLRDANAKDYRIPKSEIEARTKSPVSIMPENLVATLTEDELLDLVEYLLTLK